MRHGTHAQFNEYTIFLLLEEERTHRLIEVKEKRQTKSTHRKVSADEVAVNLKLPPRYQDLGLSIEWFMSRLDSPVNDSEASAQEWKQLDRTTVTHLSHLTAKLRLEHPEHRHPRNQFEGFVQEAQRNLVTLPAICSSKHLKTQVKPKPDLGAWFDNWFQGDTNKGALDSQPNRDKYDDLGTCFERLFESPKIASLQSEMFSTADASNGQSRFKEVDMSDKEIVDLWLAHRF